MNFIRQIVWSIAISVPATCSAQLPSHVPDATAPTADAQTADVAAQRATERLLEDLRSPKFAARRNASRKLQQLGVSAHRSLERIVLSADLAADSESATRALDLLKAATRSQDDKIVASAVESLRRIAASDSPLAKTAAQALLDPADANSLPGVPRLAAPALQFAPRFQFGPAAPQFNPPAFAPQGRINLRISVRTINGVREIEVVENDKKYRFRDVDGGLETERPDGNGGVKKHTYKDGEELRQKDAEAYRIYQKAGGDKRAEDKRGGPAIEAVPENAPLLPPPPPQPKLAPAADRVEV